MPPLIIEAAVNLSIFDALDTGPKTVEEIGQRAGASARGLRAIADALVSFDLLSKEGDRYELTPESSTFLVSTKPSFQGGFFRHISSQLIPKWLHLNEVVRSGKPARAVNDEREGIEFFEKFVEDIFPMSYPAVLALAAELRLAEAVHEVCVLDIASGSGVWGIGLAQASPRVKVTALDWLDVLKVTR
ncbi:MAG: methyltransferase family protein [Verrucomicrobiales bacterium]